MAGGEFNTGVKRLLWVVTAVLTVVSVAIWVAVMLDEWSGFVARGGVPGALFAGVLCLVGPAVLVWGGAAVARWIRAGFAEGQDDATG